MLKISMLVSFLVADLDQQVYEELGGTPPGPQAFNEALSINQDQLLMTTTKQMAHSVP